MAYISRRGELANALRAHGVAHELMLLEGIGHIFHLDEWNGQPMRDLTPPWLRSSMRTWDFRGLQRRPSDVP